MLRLHVLGQVDLRDSGDADVRAVLVQPKRLALLVYLAASHPGGFHRRDLLLPLFWPELPADRARNALRQAVHQLRRALGDEAVTSRGGDALGIDASRVWCDARAFDAALERGALADALDLYRGDLLPGFAIPGAGFERWLEETRSRFRARAARTAWALAEQQERAGAPDRAAELAHRAAALAGDNEAALRQLMCLLERIGDFSGAVRVYEEFAQRLQRDLELEPSAETTALVDALRSRNRRLERQLPPDAVDRGPRVVPAAHAGHVSHAALSERANGESALVLSVPSPVRALDAVARRPLVVVRALENLSGDGTLDFVGRFAAEAIAQALAETRLVDVVSRPLHSARAEDADRKRELGDMEVSGSYFESEDACCFQLGLSMARDRRVLGTVAGIRAPRARPWEAAGELRRRVTGMVVGHVDSRLASWADAVVEPSSYEAYREHVLGLELHLRGEFRAAIAHFLRSADPERGFTMPLLWAVQASCNLEEYEQAEAILDALRGHRGRLSPFERLGCDYFTASLGGDRTAALALTRQAAELVPQSEVLSQLGREALFLNRPRLAVEALERLDAERGWIPAWTPHWRRLTEAHHLLGDHERELAAARRGREQHPEAVSTLLYEARAHVALGDLGSVERCADEVLMLPADRFATPGEVLRVLGAELRAHGHAGESHEVLRRALDWYREHEEEVVRRPAHRYERARASYDAERWTEAEALLEGLAREQPEHVDLVGSLGAVAARRGDQTRARAAVDRLTAMPGRHLFGRHLVWSARIATLLGELDRAMALLRSGFARGYCHGVELHADADLAALRTHAPFQQLLRPRG